jgi:integrase
MYASKDRQSKGTVSVEVFQGRLRLRLPRQLFEGKQKYLTLGLSDTKINLKIAEAKAQEIQTDIVLERFDYTLDKYRPTHLKPVTMNHSQQALNLGALWDKYMEFKKPIASPSTIGNQYAGFTRAIALLPSQNLKDSVMIRDWIVANKPPNAAKRLIVQLNACCKWGMKSGLITENPFLDMASEIKLPKNQRGEDNEISPFNREERDLIIEAFAKHPHYRYYTAYVQFCFFTGCRPSEAIGLQWKHIDFDNSVVKFRQAVVFGEGYQPTVKDGLKTQEKRDFPINNQLREILTAHKSEEAKPNDFVFSAKEGGFIRVNNFANVAWRKVLESCGIEYRKPYQTRHSFITLCLDAHIEVKDVAKWVGNSPEIIYRHYAAHLRSLAVPEL